MKNEKGNTPKFQLSHKLKVCLLLFHFSFLCFSFNKKGLPWKEPAIANL